METTRLGALPKGTAFARAAIALALAKGSEREAQRIAASRWHDSPATIGYLKAAVAAGTSSDNNWAGPLIYQDTAASEFATILRAGSIAGRLPEMRRVPFSVRYPRETAAASIGWLGEGAAAAVSKLQLTSNTLGFAKCAGIVVVTKDLIASADPDAENLIRNHLIAGAIEFLDQQFISPSVAAVVNTSPASILNGITPTQSTGSTATLIAADLATLVTTLADANETDALYWVMTRSDAVRLAAKRDTAGAPAFPNITATGGTLLGIPVIASNAVPHSVSAGSIVALVNAAGIDYADGNSVDLMTSEQAALQMDSAPTQNAATPTGTSVVSMYQTNSVAVRIVVWRNYALRRSTAATYLDNCHF